MLVFYRYLSGIYHLFDSFGEWYGNGKCGMVFFLLILLIVLGLKMDQKSLGNAPERALERSNFACEPTQET